MYREEKVTLIQFTVSGINDAVRFSDWCYKRGKHAPVKWRASGKPDGTHQIDCMCMPEDAALVRRWALVNASSAAVPPREYIAPVDPPK